MILHFDKKIFHGKKYRKKILNLFILKELFKGIKEKLSKFGTKFTEMKRKKNKKLLIIDYFTTNEK